MIKSVLRTCFILWMFCFVRSYNLYSQEVRLDNLKEQFVGNSALKINGGLSANGVYYKGNHTGRDPFIWLISGNVNLTFFDKFNLPFTCNLNNMGSDYSYPILPNRLSFHPVYKWIKAHIGDVSMDFSPYTLNGHQFTGVGVEMEPENLPLKFGVMYGRLLKSTEFDTINSYGMGAYKRMGYAFGAEYEHQDFLLKTTLFHGHDDPTSLSWQPDSLQIFPQSNLAISLHATAKMIKNFLFQIEYGMSFFTRDLRLPIRKNSPGKWLLDRNQSTVRYQALKAGFNYHLKKNTFGFGYERIDPDYQTLGAYYFTNDLENFTFNFARPFWGDKIMLSLNVGLQHDNLDKQKAEQTDRFVGAFSLDVNPSLALNLSLSFSSFQTYTNIKSQFNYINEMVPYENFDTLDFTQISQDINLSIGYIVQENDQKNQTLNVMFSYQKAADKEGDRKVSESASDFYNFNTVYGIFFVPIAVQLNVSGNFTYNVIGRNKMFTYGPTAGISSKLFKKKISTGLSVSYNTTENDSSFGGSVFNIRGNLSWHFLKHHLINLSVVNQFRNLPSEKSSSDFTTTLTYSYSF